MLLLLRNSRGDAILYWSHRARPLQMTLTFPQDNSRLLTRSFGFLVLAHFMQSLGFSSMLLLPLYLDHLGANRAVIGTIMAAAGLSGLITRPAVAWMLDRWGRKPTLTLGTVTLSLSMALMLGVDSVGYLVYIQRAILGVGIGALFAGYLTLAADIVPKERRTEGLALFGVAGVLPLLVNPFADQLGIAAADLRWFFPVIGAVILASLLFLWRLPEPDIASTADSSVRPPMRQALRALSRWQLWPVWMATTGFGGLIAVFMTFAAVSAEHRAIENVPSLWLTYVLGAVSVRIVGGRLPDIVGPSNMIAPAIGLYIASMLLLTMASSFNEFLLTFLLAGLGHGYCFPLLSSQVVGRMPDTFRGSGMAFFTALWSITNFVFTPVFGAIADRYGDAAMFVSTALFGIIVLTIWLILEHVAGRRD